jgi:hypothetical protein
VELGHGGEVGGEDFTVTGLQGTERSPEEGGRA